MAVKKLRIKPIPELEFRILSKYHETRFYSNECYNPPEILPRHAIQENKHESKFLRICQHENVLKYYETYIQGSFAYIVTEMCLISLETLLPISIPLIFFFISNMLNGLKYIHSQGIVHRDIKPGNILIDKAYVPKLSDFGLAGRVRELKKRRTRIVGTHRFIAPEIYCREPVTTAVDMHSVGVTLLNLRTNPFSHFLFEMEDKAYFSKILPENAVMFTATETLQGLYNLGLVRCGGEEGDVLTLAKCCITYKQADRISLQNFQQHEVIRKYDQAWKEKNEVYYDCIKQIKEYFEEV